MAHKYKTKSGKVYTLMNPAEKGKKCAYELKHGGNMFTGVALTNTQKAYRSGYLASRKDESKAYNWNKKHRAVQVYHG